jgi:hypothetical protein
MNTLSRIEREQKQEQELAVNGLHMYLSTTISHFYKSLVKSSVLAIMTAPTKTQN